MDDGLAHESASTPLLVANTPPTTPQRRMALVFALALLVIFAGTWPIRTIQLPAVNAFLPAIAAALCVADSVAAALLFSQFSILRQWSLLILANGYLFSAALVLAHALAFPGVFAPNGFLVVGTGLQSAVWIYWLWHATLIISFTGYALLKDKSAVIDARFARLAVGLSVVGVFVAVVGLYLFVTRYESLLPITFTDVRPISAFRRLVGGVILVVAGSAGLCLLWMRRSSLLDQWLMVALLALVLEIFMASAFGARYSLGWYAARFYQLVTATTVLIILLAEMTGLYASLARSNMMLQAERSMLQRAVQAQNREREARLMTGDAISAAIAHEVKQPLSAMIIRADTCFRWLNSSAPDLDKTKVALQRIAADGHRAGAVIEGVRANFRKNTQARTEVDINSLVLDTLQLVSDDVKRHDIFVEVDPNPGLPRVLGDRIQLQQVLLNLLTNAIESMSAKQGRRALRIKAELGQTGEVEVSVEDTGLGIGKQDVDRVFNPLFTTKSGGMGMGLSICRSIVEAHEGQLWALPNTPEGAVFRFALRAAKA